MNLNEPDSDAQDLLRFDEADPGGLPATEEELRSLAEDIVRYCPSLTHLLLALGSNSQANPLHGLN